MDDETHTLSLLVQSGLLNTRSLTENLLRQSICEASKHRRRSSREANSRDGFLICWTVDAETSIETSPVKRSTDLCSRGITKETPSSLCVKCRRTTSRDSLLEHYHRNVTCISALIRSSSSLQYRVSASVHSTA